MVKRREKSEKTSMLDRQIKKVVERIIAYDILERRYWSRFTRNGKVFYRDMSWSLKGAAKEDYELLLLLCELKVRRGVRKCRQTLKEK